MESQANNAPGRPSVYSDELADTICERIAGGESLRRICSEAGFPNRQTVLNWLADSRFAQFSAKYARAREYQADYLAEEMQDVADIATPDDVQVARLRVLTMQWRASKLAPKKYGDKLDATLSGPNGGPMQIEEIRRTVFDPAPAKE